MQWLEGCGNPVTCRGTVLCVAEPWLSVSPDRVLSTGEPLEIKCPLPRNSSMEDLIGSQRFVVKMVEGRPQLQQNGPRGYYTHVQLCAGLTACKLLLWSSSQQVMLVVLFDEEFCARRVARLKMFYFKFMLPHLCEEFDGGRLALSKRYIEQC